MNITTMRADTITRTTASSTTTSTTTVEEPEVDIVAELGIDPCVLGDWVLDNNSYAEATTAITGATVSVEGLNVLSLFISFPDPDYDQMPLLLDEHFGFSTEVQAMGDSASFVLDASDMGTFSTDFDQPGRGVLTGINVYSLGTDNRITMSVGDATVTVGERMTRVDVPGYRGAVESGTGEISGWEQPRTYECRGSELLFLSPGAPPIRYVRD